MGGWAGGFAVWVDFGRVFGRFWAGVGKKISNLHTLRQGYRLGWSCKKVHVCR